MRDFGETTGLLPDAFSNIKILLPPAAKLLTADPTATVKLDANGRTHLRFHGTTIDDKQYIFTIRYELPSTSQQQE